MRDGIVSFRIDENFKLRGAYDMKPKSEGDIAARAQLLQERAKTQPSATLSLAEILTRQGKAKDAIVRLRAIEPDYRESYRFHVILARAYHAAGDHETAKRLLEKACALAPQNEVALRDLLRLRAPALLQQANATAASGASKSGGALSLPSFSSIKPAAELSSKPAPKGAIAPDSSGTRAPIAQAPPSMAMPIVASPPSEKEIKESTKAQVEPIESKATPEPVTDAKPAEPPKTPTPVAEEKLLTADDIFDETGLFVGEFGASEPAREIPEISFAPEPKEPPKYDSVLDLSQIPEQKEDLPAIELDAPKVALDRAKLSQVLSRLSLGEEKSQSESEKPAEPAPERDRAPAALRAEENGASAKQENANGAQASDVASETKTEALEKLGAQASAAMPAPKETVDDIEALAAELANFKAPPVHETNDPTPVAEQRKPFDDDEEIKVPTRQLAEIFVAQGAFAKAIKVYEALAQKEPHNALLFNIIINGLRAQAK